MFLSPVSYQVTHPDVILFSIRKKGMREVKTKFDTNNFESNPRGSFSPLSQKCTEESQKDRHFNER